MASVGSFCGIRFRVSDSEVKTIESFTWSSSARYAVHQRHGGKELPEKVGNSLEKITFSMTLSAYLGADPMEEYKKLRSIVAGGRDGAFVLGRKRIGAYHWTATEASLTAVSYDKRGGVTAADIKVTLQEYPRT